MAHLAPAALRAFNVELRQYPEGWRYCVPFGTIAIDFGLRLRDPAARW
jgi:hypothetical protein